MHYLEFFKNRRQAEFPTFKKVLEALPKAEFDYRPHERSPSAKDIAWTLAAETGASIQMVRTGRVDWQHVPAPDPSEILTIFENSYKALDEAIAGIDEKKWQETCGLYVDGKAVMEMPLGDFLWFLFFDAIHHRGQLSTYIRPMGGKVPAIYGPSGDEQPGS
jgi:uncharacterized damage-inducible protein DinB